MIGKVLIVGGGVGGMSAAIALRRAGAEVELIDADPVWRVYGAGISLTGISLRAFEDLGVLEEVREHGFLGTGMRGKSVRGDTVMEAPVLERPLPIQQTGGILRPVLHRILSARVLREGIRVRLGVKVTTLVQDGKSVEVHFSDGQAGQYALVVGADGIHSQIRSMIFPEALQPQFTGQGCWRVVAKRPAEVDCVEMYFGGPVKLGINPVSRDEMYMFILEHVPGNPRFADEDLVPHVRALMEVYGGAVPAVRENVATPSQVNYRPLEWHLLPDPWWKERVVLIGDAAHATTPHMASGAGVAAEDGLVLARELKSNGSVAAALRTFMERRFERARLVVENSVRIGELEMAGADSGSTYAISGRTMGLLQAPY